MQTPIERIRISTIAEEQLNKLKRTTGIKQWNILCRWALCRSLAEPTIPSKITIQTNSNIEIVWSVFAGNMSDLLLIALKQRCKNDGFLVNNDLLREQLLLHLHRGISYLAGDSNLNNIEDLIRSTTIGFTE